MSAELPDRRALALEATDPFAAELNRLQQVASRAFSLAKSGATSRGHLLLREGRDHALRFLVPGNADTALLLRKWDVAVLWFERFAPSPLR